MELALESPMQDEAKDPGEVAVMRITAVQRPLYAYIRSMIVSPDDVEDILQEVNLVLWRKLGQFDGRGPFLTWACHIAFLQVRAYCKKRKRHRQMVFGDSVLFDIARSMAEKVEQIDARLEALSGCLKKLGPSQRQMILRRYERGATVQAIAAEVGRPAESVRVTLHRIRQALIDCMGRTLAGGGQP